MLPWILTAVCAAGILLAIMKLRLLKADLDALSEQIDEKLNGDTNVSLYVWIVSSRFVNSIPAFRQYQYITEFHSFQVLIEHPRRLQFHICKKYFSPPHTQQAAHPGHGLCGLLSSIISTV